MLGCSAKIARLRAPLPAPQAALLDDGCRDLLPAVLRLDRRRRIQHRLRRRPPQERALRDRCENYVISLGLLHVRDDGVRRQRRRARRRDRLRPDRPLDADHASSTTCSAASSAPSRSRRSAFLVVPLGDLARLADAVGRPARRSGPNRLVDHLYAYFVLALPSLFLTSARLLRAGDDHPLDDGDLPRRRRLPGRAISLLNVGRSRSADGDRDRRAVRPGAPQATRRATGLWPSATRLLPALDGGLLYNRADLDRHRRRSAWRSPAPLTASPTRACRSASASAEASLIAAAEDAASRRRRARRCPDRNPARGAARPALDAHPVRNEAGLPEPGLRRADGVGAVHHRLFGLSTRATQFGTADLPDDADADSAHRAGSFHGDPA